MTAARSAFRRLSTVAPLLAAWLLAGSIVHAGDRVITHEDLWLMPRASQPVASPDGRWAVLTVVEPAYDPERQVTDLWLVATDGRMPPRRLTAGNAAEAGPAWSADGRWLAFSAKRDGDDAPQIYLLDPQAGGDALRATAISTGARLPQFSPDGRRLLFTSNLHPQARNDEDSRRIAKERSERKYNARVYLGFPVRNWDRWRDEEQPRVLVQTLGEPVARDLMVGSDLLAAAGFGGRVTPGAEELDAIWAPDGQSVIVVASRNRNASAFDYTHTDLWQLPLDGSAPRRLTGSDAQASGDSHEQPRFSADGRRLYALVTPRTDRVFNSSRLIGFAWPPRADGQLLQERQRIALPDDESVGSFAVHPDGRRVYLTAERAGHEPIYLAGRQSSTAELAVAPERGVYSQLAIGGSAGQPVLLAMYESATEPPELVRINARGGGHQALTAFTRARAAALDLAPLEHFWTELADGRRVHSMLVRPPGFDPAKKYPLLVLMHGGPHTMWRDMWVLRWHYHLLAAPGYVVLLTNYRGSTGYGERFAQSIQGDPLKGPADEINAAADDAIRRFPFIDGDRQCAAGASYGGHLANWMQASTTRYRCLVSHAGLVNLASQWGTSDIAYSREANQGGPHWEDIPLWREQNPISYAAKFQTPTLVTFGERDFRVPINNGLEYWATLQRQRVESRLVVFPDEHHWILRGENSRYFYTEVHDWLARWLAP